MKIIFTVLSVLLLSVPAFCADWSFYGSARMGTFWGHNDFGATPAPGAPDDDDDLVWDLSDKSRLGARVKADKVSGRVELALTSANTHDGNVQARLIYGVWKFADDASLKVGKDAGPLTQYISNSAYDSDNNLQGIGLGYDFRPGQIAIQIGGFQLALIQPYSLTDFNGAAAGVGGDVDEWLPKIEARYDLKFGQFSFAVLGGFQTYKVEDPTVGTDPDSFDVNAWLVGGEFRLPFGGFYVNAAVNFGENWSSGNWNRKGYTNNANAGAVVNADGDGTQDCFSWQAALVLGYKLNESLTFEVGGGFRSDDQDAADHKDEAWQVYAQAAVKLAPGVYWVPEIGYFDYLDNPVGVNEGYEWYAGAKWQIDF